RALEHVLPGERVEPFDPARLADADLGGDPEEARLLQPRAALLHEGEHPHDLATALDLGARQVLGIGAIDVVEPGDVGAPDAGLGLAVDVQVLAGHRELAALTRLLHDALVEPLTGMEALVLARERLDAVVVDAAEPEEHGRRHHAAVALAARAGRHAGPHR